MGFETKSLDEKLTLANLVAGLIHVIVDHGWAPDTAALDPCFSVRPVKNGSDIVSHTEREFPRPFWSQYKVPPKVFLGCVKSPQQLSKNLFEEPCTYTLN